MDFDSIKREWLYQRRIVAHDFAVDDQATVGSLFDSKERQTLSQKMCPAHKLNLILMQTHYYLCPGTSNGFPCSLRIDSSVVEDLQEP